MRNEVSNCGRKEDQRATASETSEQAEDDEGGKTGSQSACDVGHDKEATAGKVERRASIDFGERRDDQRSEGVANDKDRDDEGAQGRVCGLEVVQDLGDSGSKDG